MNARAIALQGLGFSPRLVAVQGFGFDPVVEPVERVVAMPGGATLSVAEWRKRYRLPHDGALVELAAPAPAAARPRAKRVREETELLLLI